MDSAAGPLIVVAALVFGLLWLAGGGLDKGRRGERRIDRCLRSGLPEGYHVFRDLTLPSRGNTTQIDHLVVSPFGVFVIETKTMSGWIFGGAQQRRWKQIVHRHRRDFQNPIHQNFGHVKAVESLLGLAPAQVHNLVTFAGTAVPKTPMPPDVSWTYRQLLGDIRSRDIRRLSE